MRSASSWAAGLIRGPGLTEFTVKSERVLFPGAAEPRPGLLFVRDGKIAEVDGAVKGQVLDFGKLVVMPGIVDTHAHINEPGRTDWEGFRSATRAAAAGGITTVV